MEVEIVTKCCNMGTFAILLLVVVVVVVVVDVVDVVEVDFSILERV